MSISSNPASLLNQLPLSIVIPEDEEISDVIEQLYKRIADAVNKKAGALYSLQERGNFEQYSTTIVNSQVSFSDVYRIVFDMVALNGGPIAPGSTVTFPTNVTGMTNGTHVYGCATDSSGNILPLPYSSATLVTNQIEIKLSNTAKTVTLINGSTQSALASATIVAEYLKT